MKIKCDKCGEVSYTTCADRIDSEHGLTFVGSKMKRCTGKWRLDKTSDNVDKVMEALVSNTVLGGDGKEV